MIEMIVTTIFCLIVYILFGHLATKFTVLSPYTPWLKWITVVVAIVTAVYILVKIVLLILKAKRRAPVASVNRIQEQIAPRVAATESKTVKDPSSKKKPSLAKSEKKGGGNGKK